MRRDSELAALVMCIQQHMRGSARDAKLCRREVKHGRLDVPSMYTSVLQGTMHAAAFI